MGFLRSYRIESIGFVGGIWFVWNPSRVPVTPWLMAGDFNSIAFSFEKLGRATASSSRCRFVEPQFTWKRGVVEERLDRVLCDLDWRTKYIDATLYHLPCLNSTHRSLLIKVNHVEHPSSRTAASYWNKNVFGNIGKRKSNLLKRIVGVERALELHPNSQYLLNIEPNLKLEMENV
ncbi:uncharacterized protein LOC131174036 [Hevea brasiliensis]|uniref:uncharacterized protein LOC131174036 n=1 Tax=Hevea brasiliensis TaxID=3981 RepID=UPI0025FACA52|nr:uncharacterized protein LOC131174036 [Hevea brasiliensis]